MDASTVVAHARCSQVERERHLEVAALCCTMSMSFEQPATSLPPRLQVHGAPAAFVRRVPAGGLGPGWSVRGAASAAAATALSRSAATDGADNGSSSWADRSGTNRSSPSLLTPREASLSQREARLRAGEMELLRCANEVALADAHSPALSSFSPAALVGGSSSARLRKLDEVLKRRLQSLRFLSEHQARLGDRLTQQETVEMQDRQREVSKMRKQLDAKEAQLASRANRLAEAQARLADAEQRCVHEVRAREAELRARQDEIDECVDATREVNAALAQQEHSLNDLNLAMVAMEKQADQLRQDTAALEERRQEVDVRELALRCMEAAWDKAMPPGRGGSSGEALDVDAIRAACADTLASALLRNEPYLRRLRALVSMEVRRASEVRPATELATVASGNGRMGGVTAAELISGSGASGLPEVEDRADFPHMEDEGVSAVSTADLGEGVDEEEGELHESLQWEASASVESGGCWSEGGAAATAGPEGTCLVGDEASACSESDPADCAEPAASVGVMPSPGRPVMSPKPGTRWWTPASPPPPTSSSTVQTAVSRLPSASNAAGIPGFAATPTAPPPRRTASAPPETPRSWGNMTLTSAKHRSPRQVLGRTSSAVPSVSVPASASSGTSLTPAVSGQVARMTTPRSSQLRSAREEAMPHWMQAGLLWRSTAGPLTTSSLISAGAPLISGSGDLTPASPSFRRERQESIAEKLSAGPVVPLISNPCRENLSLSPVVGRQTNSARSITRPIASTHTPAAPRGSPPPWASPRLAESPVPGNASRGRLMGASLDCNGSSALGSASISSNYGNAGSTVALTSSRLLPTTSRVLASSTTPAGSLQAGSTLAASPTKRAASLAQSPRVASTVLPESLQAASASTAGTSSASQSALSAPSIPSGLAFSGLLSAAAPSTQLQPPLNRAVASLGLAGSAATRAVVQPARRYPLGGMMTT